MQFECDMNSLPSDLDYNIIAGKGTAGSLAIRADDQATCFMEITDFFPKKHPFSLNFEVLAQA